MAEEQPSGVPEGDFAQGAYFPRIVRGIPRAEEVLDEQHYVLAQHICEQAEINKEFRRRTDVRIEGMLNMLEAIADHFRVDVSQYTRTRSPPASEQRPSNKIPQEGLVAQLPEEFKTAIFAKSREFAADANHKGQLISKASEDLSRFVANWTAYLAEHLENEEDVKTFTEQTLEIRQALYFVAARAERAREKGKGTATGPEQGATRSDTTSTRTKGNTSAERDSSDKEKMAGAGATALLSIGASPTISAVNLAAGGTAILGGQPIPPLQPPTRRVTRSMSPEAIGRVGAQSSANLSENPTAADRGRGRSRGSTTEPGDSHPAPHGRGRGRGRPRGRGGPERTTTKSPTKGRYPVGKGVQGAGDSGDDDDESATHQRSETHG